jgi:large subunit ribosomal protein L27Ae
MRHFHESKNLYFTPSVNVDHLWHILGAEALASAQAGKAAPVLDVGAFGYHKVLGKGLLPKAPIVVKARFVSAIAEKKIRAAGGAIILTA